jgi:protein SCO1/2
MNKAIVVMVVLSMFGCKAKQEKSSRVEQLPYYSEATFTPQWFASSTEVPEDFHRIPAFHLQNQLGQTITEKNVSGKVYVVDFFFTSCPGICPKMTSNMAVVQEAFLDDDEVLLLSHSVTPDYDSVPVLREYADLKGVIDGKWHLLTGTRNEIYDLGRNHYFVEEDLGLTKAPEDFIHTENFILVDENRYIRGIYNGLNKTSVAQLIADIKTLEKS